MIKRDMVIGDIVMVHPELVPLIMDYGVHCVNCGAAEVETLEEGFLGHGMTNEEVDEAVDKLNQFLKDNKK